MLALAASAQKEYRGLIKQHIYADYKKMYKQPEGGALLYPYLTPGSNSYAAVLWDWDSWLDNRTFCAPYGVRTLSKLEKMYNLRATHNPSNWQGPVWGISNYLVFRGLADYGFNKEARQMAEKTITLFGEDLRQNGTLHEYYDPDTGAPIINPGFQNWNYLVLNMIAWIEDQQVIREF